MKPLPAPAAAEGLYRAVWRWHFYAGLLVLPFLLLLAATGGLYLFHHEIDAWWHRDLRTVSAGEPVRSHQAVVDAALAVQPGRFVRYVPADAPTASAQVDIVSASGDKWMVYVDPPRARVLGSLPDRGSLMGTVRRLHSLKIVGPVARGLVEMAAGWALLLAATGVYLWWPRGQAGGVVSVRGVPRQRVFWRDVHAVTGSVAALFIVFLAATGMPWSVLWGAQVNQWANGSNLGYPAGVRVAVPLSDEHLDHAAPTAWSLQQARVPLSTDRASAMLGLDAAIALVEARGIAPGYAITPPAGPTGRLQRLGLSGRPVEAAGDPPRCLQRPALDRHGLRRLRAVRPGARMGHQRAPGAGVRRGEPLGAGGGLRGHRPVVRVGRAGGVEAPPGGCLDRPGAQGGCAAPAAGRRGARGRWAAVSAGRRVDGGHRGGGCLGPAPASPADSARAGSRRRRPAVTGRCRWARNSHAVCAGTRRFRLIANHAPHPDPDQPALPTGR